MQDIQVGWILDQLNQFSERRINDRVMDCAEKLAPVFLEKALQGSGPIDSAYIARNSIEIAKELVAGYVDNKLI